MRSRLVVCPGAYTTGDGVNDNYIKCKVCHKVLVRIAGTPDRVRKHGKEAVYSGTEPKRDMCIINLGCLYLVIDAQSGKVLYRMTGPMSGLYKLMEEKNWRPTTNCRVVTLGTPCKGDNRPVTGSKFSRQSNNSQCIGSLVAARLVDKMTAAGVLVDQTIEIIANNVNELSDEREILGRLLHYIRILTETSTSYKCRVTFENIMSVLSEYGIVDE